METAIYSGSYLGSENSVIDIIIFLTLYYVVYTYNNIGNWHSFVSLFFNKH